jgi:hypothetical protein
MRKLVTGAGIAAVALAATLASATPASATPSNEGAACIQAGLGTLKSAGLLQDAAQKQVDYSTLVAGLPAGTYLPLGQVVKLHKTNPELFSWCG